MIRFKPELPGDTKTYIYIKQKRYTFTYLWKLWHSIPIKTGINERPKHQLHPCI